MLVIFAFLYAVCWLILGPISTVLMVPVFLARREDEDNGSRIPNLKVTVLFVFFVGAVLSILLEHTDVMDPIVHLSDNTAALRLIDSALSKQVINGNGTASNLFFMEQIGAVISLLVGIAAFRNPGRVAKFTKFYIIQLRSNPKNKPMAAVVMLLVLVMFSLLRSYFFPANTRRIEASHVAQAMLPVLTWCGLYFSAMYLVNKHVPSTTDS